jgi:hypothetical protein
MNNSKHEAKPKKSSNGQPKTPKSIDVDKVVKKINQRAIETVELGAMDIGELVLKEVFGGNLSDALSRNPNKDVSLQQVAQHPDLLVNRRTLGTWVRAANLRKVLIAKKVDCSNLRYSHFAALLRVTDENKCRELAERAHKSQWSARKTIAEIDGMKQKRMANGNGNGNKDTQETVDKSLELIRMVENPVNLAAKEAAEKFSTELKSLLQLKSSNRWDIVKVIESVLDKIKASSEFLNKWRHSLIANDLNDLNPEQA